MAVLYGKKRGSRYDFRNDVQMLLGWIEELRDVECDEPGMLFVCGVMDLAQLDRIRGAAGMAPLHERGEVQP